MHSTPRFPILKKPSTLTPDKYELGRSVRRTPYLFVVITYEYHQGTARICSSAITDDLIFALVLDDTQRIRIQLARPQLLLAFLFHPVQCSQTGILRHQCSPFLYHSLSCQFHKLQTVRRFLANQLGLTGTSGRRFIFSTLHPTLRIDSSSLLPLKFSSLALLLVMNDSEAPLSHITLTHPFFVLILALGASMYRVMSYYRHWLLQRR